MKHKYALAGHWVIIKVVFYLYGIWKLILKVFCHRKKTENVIDLWNNTDTAALVRTCRIDNHPNIDYTLHFKIRYMLAGSCHISLWNETR